MNGSPRQSPQPSKSRKRKVSKLQQEKQKTVFWQLASWLLIIDRLFHKVSLHGNIKWKAEEVAIQALIWSLLEAKNLTDTFDQCLIICAELSMKNIAHTYNSFMNALWRQRELFSEVIDEQFQTLAEQAWQKTDGALLQNAMGH